MFSFGEYQVKKPLWLRRLIASWKAYRGSEYGGLLTNWKQGEFEIIAEWKTDQGCEEVWQLVENLYESGRDEIYVALVKMGYNKGYFVIHGGGFHMPIAFWDGYFSFDDAYKLMKARCRVIGTKMGYRNLEVDNAQTEN